MDQNLAAAKRHFPARGRAIEELAARNDDFRALCTDLADAETEVQRLVTSVLPKRDQRVSEYLELVRDLVGEIEAALDAAAIIPFPGRRP